MEKNLIKIAEDVYITEEKLIELCKAYCSKDISINKSINKDLKDLFSEVLISLGGREVLSGFTYTIEALNLLFHNPNIGVCELYDETATICNSSASRVERAIRHFVLSLESEHTNKYIAIFGNRHYKVGDFIWKLMTHIKIYVLKNKEN